MARFIAFKSGTNKIIASHSHFITGSGDIVRLSCRKQKVCYKEYFGKLFVGIRHAGRWLYNIKIVMREFTKSEVEKLTKAVKEIMENVK